MIHQYNKHMGGVDLNDMLMSLYRIESGSRKWYTNIVYYYIEVAVTNCWVLYNTHCTQNGITQLSKLLALLEFQARIADSLLHQKNASFWWKTQKWWSSYDKTQTTSFLRTVCSKTLCHRVKNSPQSKLMRFSNEYSLKICFILSDYG